MSCVFKPKSVSWTGPWVVQCPPYFFNLLWVVFALIRHCRIPWRPVQYPSLYSLGRNKKRKRKKRIMFDSMRAHDKIVVIRKGAEFWLLSILLIFKKGRLSYLKFKIFRYRMAVTYKWQSAKLFILFIVFIIIKDISV